MSEMPEITDARQVLSHLNYLGYTNINAHQLKAFMIDLKRFVKYDERCQQEEQQKHQLDEQPVRDVQDKENQCPNQQRNERDIFEALHETDTVASKAKKKQRSPKKQQRQFKQHIITVEIHNPRTDSEISSNIVPKIVIPQTDRSETAPERKTTQKHVNNHDDNEENIANCPNCHCNEVKLTAPPNSECALSVGAGGDGDGDGKSAPSTSKSVPILPLTASTTTTTCVKKSGRSKSARSAFIRPKIANKPMKSDPVTLYHQYKQEWDKIKFPGEHQHGETRWAVREKLLGDRYY